MIVHSIYSSPVMSLDSAPMSVFLHCILQIALASFPGSGNTWYRHLIEDITGIVHYVFIWACINMTLARFLVAGPGIEPGIPGT